MSKPQTTKLPPVEKPNREPDHISKRGVWYFFSPEWVRGTDFTNTSFGRIKAIKSKDGKDVSLYMQSKTGNLTYILGSIQREFKEWHEQRKIDYFFLADDPEALDDFILASDRKD